MAQLKRTGIEEELAAEAARRGLRLKSSSQKEREARRTKERRDTLDRIERKSKGEEG